jgi:transcriptional regulator with XRE-family HTH domain
MPSFRGSLTPTRREAARFVTGVRRSLQKALAEESEKRGLSQSDIAREIGVHRSVINRELQGYQDITLGRVAELACALGRKPTFDLPPRNTRTDGRNAQDSDTSDTGSSSTGATERPHVYDFSQP